MWLHLSCLLLVFHCSRSQKHGESGKKLQGHHKPIGYQGIFLGHITELKFSPSGQYFYEHFIRQRRPLLIPKAANHWLAVKNWHNETYLNETYGELPFTVHMDKVYNNSLTVREDMSLAEFLKTYKEQPLYLDSKIPPSNLINEINLPSLLQCKEISSGISDVNLLMNSGNASSPLHHDGYENILTVISGTKKVIMFNSSYSENVYADDFDVLPGLSPVNPLDVDLEKFPKFSDIAFYEVELRAGDMLYIPEYWWHYVSSSGSPNIAINIWFSMFDYEEKFLSAGLMEARDVAKVAELFHRLVQQESDIISCKEQSPTLEQVLKVVENDSSSESLRIPKVAERPPDFKLASGYTMPPLGFGTAALHPDERLPVILSALDTGYRLFDTAQVYGTEAPLGQAIKLRNISRSEITIVTKLHPQYLGYESAIQAVQTSLENLQTDYIDVFLIHTKYCDNGYFKCPEGKPDGTWQDTWRAMEYLHSKGKIRSLGVSNFDVVDLKELLNFTSVPLSVVQNWFDPFHQDENVRDFCAKHRIHYMGYSTLGSQWTTYGGLEKNPVLTSPVFFEIASHYEFVIAQVILRWAIHLNVTVIPRSRDPRHIQLNFKALGMKLSEHEIKSITEEWKPGSSDVSEEEESQSTDGLDTKVDEEREDTSLDSMDDANDYDDKIEEENDNDSKIEGENDNDKNEEKTDDDKNEEEKDNYNKIEGENDIDDKNEEERENKNISEDKESMEKGRLREEL